MQKSKKPEGKTLKGIIQTGIAQRGKTQTGITQRGITQAGITQKGITQKGITQRGKTQIGVIQTGITQWRPHLAKQSWRHANLPLHKHSEWRDENTLYQSTMKGLVWFGLRHMKLISALEIIYNTTRNSQEIQETQSVSYETELSQNNWHDLTIYLNYILEDLVRVFSYKAKFSLPSLCIKAGFH